MSEIDAMTRCCGWTPIDDRSQDTERMPVESADVDAPRRVLAAELEWRPPPVGTQSARSTAPPTGPVGPGGRDTMVAHRSGSTYLGEMSGEARAFNPRTLPPPADRCKRSGERKSWSDPAPPEPGLLFVPCDFEDYIHRTLAEEGVIGYALAYQYGHIQGDRTHGHSPSHKDAPMLSQSTRRRHCLGSMEKTAAAVATLKALGTALPNLSPRAAVETKIGDYLPDDHNFGVVNGSQGGKISLGVGRGVRDLSFRQFLFMTTGLCGCAGDDWDKYSLFKQDLRAGAPHDGAHGDVDYALLRFMIYHLLGNPKPRGPLDAAKYYRYHVDTADFFGAVMEEYVFKPSGIYNPSWEDPKVDFVRSSADQRHGAGSLTLSAEEWLRFLRALSRGDLLPGVWMDEMDQSWEDHWYHGGLMVSDGDWGRYYYHDGRSLDKPSHLVCGAHAGFVIFPHGDMQAVLLANCHVNGFSVSEVLRCAYHAGWRKSRPLDEGHMDDLKTALLRRFPTTSRARRA